MTNKIDLNKLSLEELKAEIAKVENQKSALTKPKGTSFCIVRTYSAGVFAGDYDRSTKGKEGTVYNAIRLWYWKGACSLSQLANDGTKEPIECKFAQPVEQVDLKEIIEVLPCTKEAEQSIKEVPTWQK